MVLQVELGSCCGLPGWVWAQHKFLHGFGLSSDGLGSIFQHVQGSSVCVCVCGGMSYLVSDRPILIILVSSIYGIANINLV